jgi:hypothetical protein
VLCWTVLQPEVATLLQPEVAAHLLEDDQFLELVDTFLDATEPDPSGDLVARIRELWAEAPVNGRRDKILAEIGAHVRRDKGCF